VTPETAYCDQPIGMLVDSMGGNPNVVHPQKWPTRGRSVLKMKLGMQVGFGPGHIVLDATQLPLLQRGTAPIFGPYLLWPNGWMDQDATWYGVGFGPSNMC